MNKNKYYNAISKLDVDDEFKNNLIKKINEEELNKEVVKMKRKGKLTGLIATLGIIACGGVAYATVVPKEWKEEFYSKISNFFGVESTSIDLPNVQEQTINSIITSDKEDIEKYSQLLDADVYGIGDSNGGTLIETNYEQYNFNMEYDENAILEKYEDEIKINLAVINYGVLEKLDYENTIIDENGAVLERIESTLEEKVLYQYNELTTDWDSYYQGQEKFEDELFFEITGMTLMNGNNASEEDYYNYARAKKIKLIFNDGEQEETINLLDTKEAQFVDLSYIQYDISKPVNITIQVLETYDGNTSNDIYIADVQFGIESNIPQGR